MKLVAGLGNPGAEYAETRHNVGFAVADLLSDRLGVHAWSKKFKGLFASAELSGDKVLLLKPQTYMNLSGESVQGVFAFYRLQPPDLVVVHDDIDLELGRVAVKAGGGHGGHNGLRSIISALGPQFVRVRIGVGRPEHSATRHVLGGFRPEEQEAIDQAVARAADAVEVLLRDGLRTAQNQFNARPRKRDDAEEEPPPE